MFNVYYLETVATWILEQKMDFVYWNMLHDAYFFSISSLPEPAKQAIAKRLWAADVPDPVKEEFNRVADFMNQGASLDGERLRREVGNLDRRRKQDLRTVQPEFAKLIDYGGPHAYP